MDEKLGINNKKQWDVDFTLARRAITYISMTYNNGSENYSVNIYHTGSLQDSTYFNLRQDAVKWYEILIKWWTN